MSEKTVKIDVFHGDSLEVLRSLPADSVSAVVTDPPYGLGKHPDMVEVLESWLYCKPYNPKGRGFMGKSWDAFVPGPELWREVFRVMKPGAHAAVFAGTRTQDVMGLALRLAGFEIRDSVAWLYGSGFPKSLNLGDGWGTALKPGHEPILIVRKPFPSTVAANVLAHGTGGFNVDAGRIGYASEADQANARPASFSGKRDGMLGTSTFAQRDRSMEDPEAVQNTLGRWPANVALDEAAAVDLDATIGNRPGMSGGGKHPNGGSTEIAFGSGDASEAHLRGDNGGPSRFFYCPKASRSEREAGLEDFPEVRRTDGRETELENPRLRTNPRRNVHPTVKPVELMRWLLRLLVPPGGVALDPFGGSGTTGIAAAREGFDALLVEREEEYVEIARARIAHQLSKPVDNPPR